MAETEAKIIYKDDGLAQSFSAAIVAADSTSAGELVWHPFIPLGKFFHPAFGEFETTEADANEMIANLNSGLPVSKGIPIAEGPGHMPRSEGAYGWIKQLELRDSVLWAGIEWTEDGIAAVTNGNLPYISAHWVGSGEPHSTYGKANLIFDAALCTQPFFYDHPELRVATADYLSGPQATAAAAKAHEAKAKASQLTLGALGGTTMASEEIIKQARSAYEEVRGTVSDEDWQKAQEGLAEDADYEKFMAELKEAAAEVEAEPGSEDELAQLRAENEKAAQQLAEAQEKLKAAEAEAQAAAEREKDMVARLEVLETDKERAAIEKELAATVIDGQKYSPAAIEVMATAILQPTAETALAFQKHIEENGGRVGMVPVGEVEAVTATTSAGELTDEAWLEAKNITDAAKKATRDIAAEQNVSLRRAYTIYLTG